MTSKTGTVGRKVNFPFVNFKTWIILVFAAILLSRVMSLSADIPSWSVEIEEKASGYSARSKVLFGTWDSGGGWYQPSVYMPLSNVLVYLSFSIFGVGLVQLRLPFALASVLSYAIFYFVIKSEIDQKYALLGVLIISSIYPLFLVNRSALNENLFLIFLSLQLFLYQRSLRSGKAVFYLLTGFVAFLNGLVKVYGLVMILPPIISMVIESGRIRNKFRLLLFYSLGILGGIIFGIILIFSINSPKEFFDFYYFYTKYYYGIDRSYIYKFSERFFLLLGFTISLLPIIAHRLIQFFFNTPRVIFSLMPFLFIVICYGLTLQFQNRKHLSHFDYFNLLILLSGLIIVQERAAMYYKNLIFIIPSLCYIAVRSLSMLAAGVNGKIRINIKENGFWLGAIVFIFIMILATVSLDVHTGNSLIRIKKAYEENWTITRYLIRSDQFWMYTGAIIGAFSMMSVVVTYVFYKILKRKDSAILFKKSSYSVLILFFLHSALYFAKDYVFSDFNYAAKNVSVQVQKQVPRSATIGVLNEEIYKILGYGLKNRFIFVSYIESQGKEAFDKVFYAENAAYFAFLDKDTDRFDADVYIKGKCGRDALKEYRYLHKSEREEIIKIVDLKNCVRVKHSGQTV